MWMRLLQETITLNDAALVRQTFQDFFEYYHSSVHVWILLIEFEEKGRQFDQLEGIFNKCLRSVPSVELCDRYMNYVNHIHTLPEDATLEQLMESRKVVIQAFEFVLSVVGTDKCSGVIWMKFIQYVKSGDLGSTYEEQLKMDQLRKIFHRALQIPLLNIEDIWKDYDAYENSLSKLTVRMC